MAFQISAAANSKASPADVFALLTDGSTWPHWSMFRAFELERAGAPDRFGVGAIRAFTSSRRVREEVVKLVPDRQLGYILLSGIPFRHYRADVFLQPVPEGGTDILWTAIFEVSARWTAWFWKLVMQRVITSTAMALAKGASESAITDRAKGNLAQAHEERVVA